ncbi:ABC transporter [Photobacterium aquae]|uniref:ABC transporter n=1 Tax=Photobacterium aquae TaxID=1195763 RepID=A0A0J1GTW9_9GAMM|nr:ATP-binding cassette domain-containing protein [Photobacterium aquae]KLV03168.1 ABC transporter [Photobacterium aquae]
MINVEGLTKRIGEIQALNGLSFSAADGQITGILGPNGAGKTTCLRTMFGLLKQDEGKAYVDGIDVHHDPIAAKQRLGLFPDPFSLYEHLTTREYLEFNAQLSGLRPADVKAAVDWVIAELDMDSIADRKTKGFSQGQRMKVALGQAIVHRPQNIILDEPTRGLDVMSTRVLRQLLNNLKRQGHCIVFSSHVMQEVSALCDHVVVMTEGKVVASGSPASLCASTRKETLEEAFISIIGTDEGIAA